MTEQSIAILTPLPPTPINNAIETALTLYLEALQKQTIKEKIHCIFTANPDVKEEYTLFLKTHFSLPYTIIEGTKLFKAETRFEELAIHRNLLLEQAKKYDYAVFVDSDVSVPPNGIEALVNSGKDIVSGVVVVPIGLLLADGSKIEQLAVGYGNFVLINNMIASLSFANSLPDTLSQSGYVCSACLCLSQKTVLDERLRFETFQFRGKGIQLGEDLGYCYNAARLGYRIWVNPAVQCRHHRRSGEELHHLSLKSGNTLHLNFGFYPQSFDDNTDKVEA